jgi:hypothetical protein
MTVRRTATAALTILAVALAPAPAPPAQAQEPYTSDDTLAAIEQYSEEFGISYGWIYRVVGCETGWTFNPYSRGRQGELGAAQLHPRGELIRFYSWGYTDPFSPYQAVRFLAQDFQMGRSYMWSCK